MSITVRAVTSLKTVLTENGKDASQALPTMDSSEKRSKKTALNAR